MGEALKKAKDAQAAARKIAVASTQAKNQLLKKMEENLQKYSTDIIEANNKDVESGEKSGMSKALIDRLSLDEKRVNDMISGLEVVRLLPDPVGEVILGWKRPNGLLIQKVRVPIGVIGIIYEARPNVTVDAAGLCIKSGNVVILRGSSSAINSNIAIVKILQQSAEECGFPREITQLIEDTSREGANELMKLNGYVDLLIPRGGAGLIKSTIENSTIPVIETGVGNCHVYVDESADLKKAEEIAYNAKVQRPSVCNAAESLLIHEKVADKFLPEIFKRYKEAGVLIKGDEASKKIDPSIENATDEDYATEFLDYIISVKIVRSIDEAIEHIHKYGTKHTEAIVTQNIENANKFKENIDAAAVMINASTRFTDGGEFGYGAEIGISTQKLHARGPMGLPELTTIKYIVEGDGHIRS